MSAVPGDRFLKVEFIPAERAENEAKTVAADVIPSRRSCPAASADSACEGRFVNPITDTAGAVFSRSRWAVSKSARVRPRHGEPVDAYSDLSGTAAAVRRIGLAIGYWEPMALTDVTRHRDAW